MNTIEKLDETNSKVYNSRPGNPKNVVLQWEPANYTLSWGEQIFDGPHMVVVGDAPYGVELKAFFTTHLPLPEKDHWVKNVSVRAVQVTEETQIVTVIDGRVEAKATVPAGCWAVQNPGGEVYYNTNEEFHRLYVV